MHTDRFWVLMAKQLSGEINPEEQKELDYLKGEDEFAAYDDRLMKSVHNVSIAGQNEPDENAVNKRWQSFEQKINAETAAVVGLQQRKAFGLSFSKIAVAASVALLIVAGFYFFNSNKKEPIRPNIVSTKNGSRTKIQMPDGTQVWLNAGSKLLYDNNTYGNGLREVQLEGEAYFDVVKDKAHPFVIHTKTMDVKVLGTAFNVRAYPNEKKTEAALIHGLIEVSFPGRPAEKLFLKPNEKISVVNEEVQAKQTKDEDEQKTESPIILLSKIAYEATDSSVVETSWTKNKLVFRSKSFEDLAKDLERWFNVSIVFKDTSLMQRKLTGTFYNETVIEALDNLKLSSPFKYNYDKENNTFTLYR